MPDSSFSHEIQVSLQCPIWYLDLSRHWYQSRIKWWDDVCMNVDFFSIGDFGNDGDVDEVISRLDGGERFIGNRYAVEFNMVDSSGSENAGGGFSAVHTPSRQAKMV